MILYLVLKLNINKLLKGVQLFSLMNMNYRNEYNRNIFI